jgi:hypothetical protein
VAAPRRLPARKTTSTRRREETTFQSAVIDLILYRVLWYYHVHDSRTAPAGWPDLVILGQGGMLLRELKTDTGRATAEQKRVMALAEQAGQDVKIWRPADLRSGLIVAELDAIRRPRPRLQPEDVTWLIRELRGYDAARGQADDQVWPHWRHLLEIVLNIDLGTLDTTRT